MIAPARSLSAGQRLVDTNLVVLTAIATIVITSDGTLPHHRDRS